MVHLNSPPPNKNLQNRCQTQDPGATQPEGNSTHINTYKKERKKGEKHDQDKNTKTHVFLKAFSFGPCIVSIFTSKCLCSV